MDKPNIVLNIIEKNENNDKIENNNNQKHNSNKEKSSNTDNSTNIDKNLNDKTIHLSNEQKKKLQSWIDSEEESKNELEKLKIQHELLFKNIDSKIENNNNKIHMKTLMNNILNTKNKSKNKSKKSFYQKSNSKKRESVIKPYALKLF